MCRRFLKVIVLILLITPAVLLPGELSYTFDNSVGSGEYLLGNVLIPNASFASSSVTLSAILQKNIRAYLDVSHNQIHPYANYSSSEAELGLQLRYLGLKDNQFFGGVFAFTNRFHDEFSYYNGSGLGMYAKWKYYFKASQLIIAGYDVNLNQFDELAEASNTDHQIFFTYNQSFSTRTSINLTSSIAYQNFWPESVTLGSGRYQYTIEIDSIPDNSLFSSELRLSQSIGPKLGLTVWLNSQKLLNDTRSTLMIQDGLNNPFIDRFRWEGNSAAARLLYRVNRDHSLKLSYSAEDRNYIGLPVYDYDFAARDYVLIDGAYHSLGYDRSDQKQNLNLSWVLKLDRYDSLWLTGLELILNVGQSVNQSNDPLYDYSSTNYTITLNMNN